MFVVLTVCLVLGHTGRFERSGSCVSRVRRREWARKRPPVERAAWTEGRPFVDYGAYVIVRAPATLLIVIVVPWEKPVGYVSWATEFSAFT
jgi:hypothetical protein